MNCDKETHWDTFDDGCVFCALDERFALGVEYERKRIIWKLEHALWSTPIGALSLSSTLLNWIAAKGDDLTAGDIDEMAKNIVELIKGENE